MGIYLIFSQNVANKYLLIVKTFCNDSFIIFGVIKKVTPVQIGLKGLKVKRHVE